MALLRSAAARALRLRQPLERQGFLLPRSPVDVWSRRLLSSSVPTERNKGFESSDPHSRNMAEHKRNSNEKKEDILQGLSTKVDKINYGLDKNTQLLRELERKIKDNNKSREIDLTPAALLISASFVSFVLYKYVLA